MRKFSTKRLVTIALLTAVICVMAPWSVPIGPIPLTLATFAIYLAAYILGPVDATISVLVYLIIGIIGVPVFSGATGGLAKVAGPTGGYLVGYLFLACIAGFFAYKFEKLIWLQVAGMIIGTAVLYFFGTAWYCIQAQAAVGYAIGACVMPFLLGDAIKIAVASVIGIPVRKQLKKMQ